MSKKVLGIWKGYTYFESHCIHWGNFFIVFMHGKLQIQQNFNHFTSWRIKPFCWGFKRVKTANLVFEPKKFVEFWNLANCLTFYNCSESFKMSIIFASAESLFTSMSFKEICLSEAKPANFYLQIFCSANFSKFWPENCFDFFDEKFQKSFDRQRLGHIGDFCFNEKLEQSQLQAITRHHNQQKFEQRASKFLIFWQLFFMRKFLLKLDFDQLMWESPFFGFLLRSRFLFRCRNETKEFHSTRGRRCRCCIFNRVAKSWGKFFFYSHTLHLHKFAARWHG